MATKKKAKAKSKKPVKKAKAKAKAKVKPKKKAAKKAAKKSTKKPAKKKPAAKAKPKKKKTSQPKPLPPPAVEGTLVGRVEDFFAHIGVIALTLKDRLRVGDTIHIKGHTTDLTETVQSIQMEHLPLQEGKKGDSVGIKIVGIARKRDWVFRTS